jgi:hypothetical protein
MQTRTLKAGIHFLKNKFNQSIKPMLLGFWSNTDWDDSFSESEISLILILFLFGIYPVGNAGWNVFFTVSDWSFCLMTSSLVFIGILWKYKLDLSFLYVDYDCKILASVWLPAIMLIDQWPFLWMTALILLNRLNQWSMFSQITSLFSYFIDPPVLSL